MHRSIVWLSSLVVLVILTAATTTTAKTEQPEPVKGQLSYRFSDGWEEWPADKREMIKKAMNEAVALYNKHAHFKKELRITYSPSTPTADANYNGHIRFGGSINSRVALHEIGHTLGVGTTQQWQDLMKDKLWTGPNAVTLVKQFDGPDAVLHGDRQHFWPYGLNYDKEDGPEQRIRHIKMVEALAKDMNLPVFMPEEEQQPPKRGADR